MSQLAEEVERICAAGDLVAMARAMLGAIGNLHSCSDVMFCAYELDSLCPIIHQQSQSGCSGHALPKLERSRNLASSLDNGAELVTLADKGKGEYYVIYQTAADPTPELRIPFFIQPKLICLLSLGKKDSGTDYESEEIDALRILVSLLSRFGSEQERPQKRSEHPGDGKLPLTASADMPRAFHRTEDYDQLLGEGASMQRIRRLIKQIGPTDAPVLVTGESGTGKELVARAIHQSSNRNGKAMVIVNCAALPDTLVESELFGHEKGAFTGALACKQGKFEFAKGSTLFLDEIGDLSPAVQAKLLRVLQDGTFQRIGGNATLHSDARLITATNKNLLQAICSGDFRQDLYYRFNVVQIEMPPLRERREDIPALVRHYLGFYNRQYHKNIEHIDDGLLGWMMSYRFPGNIRELKNIIERVVIMENDPATIQAIVQGWRADAAAPAPAPASDASSRLEDLEREHIRTVLEQSRQNKSAAARKLGIARKTLREKIARYNL